MATFDDQTLASKQTNPSASSDKISDLPDVIIHHILSLVTTKQAVATSILSKRWLQFWTFVPILDFEEPPLPHCTDKLMQIQHKFFQFVSNVLKRNKSDSLEKFRLKCYPCYADSSSFSKWISLATARGLQEVDLDVSYPSINVNNFRLRLTTSFFKELGLLKVLKLSNRVLIDISETVSFPNLKILHLVLVTYRNDRSVHNLFSGCLVLEELFIKRVSHDNVQSFNISLPTLKSLSTEFVRLMGRSIEINAPALEYLNLKDDISILGTISGSTDFVISWSCKRTTKILSVICSVKSLSISGNIWCNELEHDYKPKFVNLVRLELNVGLYGWTLVPLLLETTPILQVLVLSVSEAFQVEEEQRSSLPELVPRCFLSHLKIVCFRNFAGLEDELHLIEYILTNARVLKTMTICSNGSFSDSDFLVHEKLSKIPRCSEACLLEFKCQKSD